jgi:hypothetical protein
VQRNHSTYSSNKAQVKGTAMLQKVSVEEALGHMCPYYSDVRRNSMSDTLIASVLQNK